MDTLRGLIEYNGLGRVLRYLQSQKKAKKSFAARLDLYRDYLDMAKRLGCNMKKRAILEPRDLKEQHDLLSSEIAAQKKDNENSQLSQAIENGLYWWAREYASDDFMVVHPQTRNDFISEGQSLNHCVGSAIYYDRHILGRQMVFFIRRTSQPEKPFFTTAWKMAGYGSFTVSVTAPRQKRCVISWKGLPGLSCGGEVRREWRGKFP